LAEQQLKRLLGRSFSMAACVGTIIGLGILRTPGEIASTIDDPWLYMGLWTAGGIFVLLSILVSAELISITPRSGGVYTLVENAFGPYPGFLLGWTDWLAQCSAGALKAVVLMEYAALLVPGFEPFITPGALLITSLFALLQLGGVRFSGGILQVAATVFGLILLSVSVSLLFGEGSEPVIEGTSVVVSTATGWAHYGIVAAAIVFTYDGWIGASYFSAEIDGGGRSAAVGSVKGLVIVIVLYLLLNGLLVANVPLSALAGSELALATALEYLYGEGAGAFIIIAALFILLAHQNTQYMAASRGLYALSVDGLGSQRATSVSEKGTPTGALFFCWLLTVVLIVAGGFEFLLNMSAVLFIFGYVMLMVGVFRMRRKVPELERPFKAWGFPVTGVFCIVGWVLVALFVGLMDLESSIYSLALTALSVPVFLWLKARRNL
jgi:APA family basic amino acid/polyamine antiporter